MKRVLSIFGTRPEAIKMAPVLRELARHRAVIESVVCVTAQHRELLDQVLGLFDIEPDVDLDLMQMNQDPATFAGRSLGTLSGVLDKVRPDVVLVQGDTTTAFVASLAAFYARISVGHVEAGLRTSMLDTPFPEEMHRRLVGRLATWHFAPTARAVTALQAEGVPAAGIFLTGNPVVDALRWISHRPPAPATQALLDSLRVGEMRTILVTAHRRENFGERLEAICDGLAALIERHRDIQVVFPVHPNPNVRETVFGRLAGTPRVHLIEPLPYEAFVHVMARAWLLLTDSGGLQEEGPVLGKPVLVLRAETERPEAVEAGTAKLVGVSATAIVQEVERLVSDRDAYARMAVPDSPFGDGHAGERIVRILLERVSSRA